MWNETWPLDAHSIRREPSFRVSGGLHALGWGWCWVYLNAMLLVLEGGCSPLPSGRMIAVRGRGVALRKAGVPDGGMA